MDEQETIAAIATAPGRGGVAVVRVSGPEAFAVATRLTGRDVGASMAGRFFLATFRSPKPNGGEVDSGLVLVFAGPRSYTGEDVVEFHGHGGSVAPRLVLEACLAAGARLARRGEFTQRAFLNGRIDLSQSEAVIDLVDAKTQRAAEDALMRLNGTASRELESLYDSALDLSCRAEHALDFSEEELPPAFCAELSRDAGELAQGIETRLSTAREGRLLREGALIVLAGAPNAGKSSLLNALLGEDRAIVSPTEGTTRDSIEAWMEIGGWPVRLVDTAGLRTTDDSVEAEGVRRAEDLIAKADVVIALDCDAPNSLRIHAKCDLAPGDGLNVSSLTGEGVPELRDAIAERLAALSAKRDEATGADATVRQREFLDTAAAAVSNAVASLDSGELVLAANALRDAAEALGGLLGRTYSDDLLDALFSRFCVGK